MTLIKKAKEIRDQIVQAYNIVNNFNLNSVNDYKKLSLKLEDQIGHRYNQNWLRKYFYLMFPNKFFPAYSSKILNHFYYSLGFYPTGNDYEKNGFLSLVLNKSLVPIINQGELLFSLFSGNKTFINIDISDFSEVFLEQLIKNNKIVLNNKLKLNFSKFLTKRFRESHLKSFLQNNLSNLSSQELSSLYQTVNSFLEVGEDSIIFITKNKKPFALIDNLNNYSYQENDEYPHSLSGNWYFPFDKSEDIDISREKPRSLPYIVNSENLLSLYQIYFNKKLEVIEEVPNITLSEKPNLNEEIKKVNFNTGFDSSFSRNLLLFGAPGTGKSYRLNEQRKELLGDLSETNYERVTFHPDYSYPNFVGSYKPTVNRETGMISYEFVPGPFARIYSKALKNTKTDNIEPFLLIIEELNRANAAAVFGDIFQLLDRINNVSEYPVTISEDFRNYLAQEVGGDITDFESIRLPDNFFIWATMNNADQGVFPIDTAFKRRWSYQPLDINENDNLISGKYILLGKNQNQKVEWNKLRKAINDFLSKERINEDKQLGPFFLNLNTIQVIDDQIDRDSFIENFKNKILIYLFEDAARRIRQKIFSGCRQNYRYSDICKEFDQKGIEIFDQEIVIQTEPEMLNSDDVE